MRHISHILVAVTALTALIVITDAVAADTINSPNELRAALDDLDRWLGSGENGQRWREFLRTKQLRTELDHGNGLSPEPKTVADILTIFSSQTPGLEKAKFQRVRQAMQAWYADVLQSTPEGLKTLLGEQKGKYIPPTAAELETAKQSLAKSVQALNAFLGKNANGDVWRSFLKLNELQAFLHTGSGTAADVLKGTEQLLSGGDKGLDAPQFDAVRKSLIAYQRLLDASSKANAGEQFDKHLDSLAAKVEAFRSNPTNADEQQIATLLRELGYTRQASSVIRAVRGNFLYPNFLVEVGTPILAAGVDKDLDEVMPVTDEIMGTSISGTGRTVGKVRLQLVPDTTRGLLQTILTGNTYTNTVGQHDPVTLFSTGVTSIYGVKPVQINTNGMTGLPATAKAVTHSKVNGLQVNRNHFVGAIENAAWQRIGENQGQAEAIGSQHAQQKIINRMDQQANVTIAKNNASMNDRIRRPLTRYGAYPDLQYSTTTDYLSVVGTAAAEDQIAAPSAPPEFPAKDAAAVRIHETALNNLAVKCYGGRRITRNDLKSPEAEQASKRMRDMFIMEESPEEKKSPEEEPNDKTISFVFDKELPIVISLSGQTLNIFMRVTDLTVDDKVAGDWDITAQYTLEKTDTGLKATMKSEAGKQQPDVVPAGFDRKSGDRIPGDKFVYVRTLRRKFGEQLKPEFNVKYVVLPGDWSKAGKLALTNLQCDKGWLALSFMQAGPVEPKSPPVKSAE